MTTKKDKRLFCGGRLSLARYFHGLTQRDLAGQLHISHPLIGQLEVGSKQTITERMLNGLCDALGFEQEFFYEPLEHEYEFRDRQCYFRRRETMLRATREQILAYGTLFAYLVSFFEEWFQPLNINSYCVHNNKLEIEQTADKCRMQWGKEGLGRDTPIDNMCKLLGQQGVIVARFETLGDKVDAAFSRPGKRHIIILSNDKRRPTRARFDAARECGHLVMHGGMEPGTLEQEEEAEYFAHAFLLPKIGFMRDFPRLRRSDVIDWEFIFRLKKRWGVGVEAIIQRAYDLELIDGVLNQRAYKYIHSHGWHNSEPEEPELEQANIISRAFDKVREHDIGYFDITRQLRWKPQTMEMVTGIQYREEPSAFKGAEVLPHPRLKSVS